MDEIEAIETTRDVKIPKNPLERIIGQERAVEKIKIAIKQRRHLLLVGPPGIGKSMLAQALALQLPPPKEEIRVVNNPANPERPLVEVVVKEVIRREEKEKEENGSEGELVTPKDVPTFVAEQLGFRCPSCGVLSSPNENICPTCGTNKFPASKFSRRLSPFSDIITEVFETSSIGPEMEVAALRVEKDGKENILIYKRVGNRIRIFDQKLLEKRGMEEGKRKKEMKVLIPLRRVPFVQASGASETELLGDVRHDPYGSHPEIGTPPYLRVIPGAIHEAHEGVLFIDELPHMAHLQNFILTAMQEKKFSIVGRNPHSAGASVKVVGVPCDFLFVGACNIRDINKILPPLRSRILGNGYEILLDTTMPDNEKNRLKLIQFIAQEIKIDSRIPHAERGAIEEVIKEAKRRAFSIDNIKSALTLRLRDLGGLIRLAGDIAILEGSEFITREHVRKSIVECKPIEHQIKERYGSMWKGVEREEVGFGVDDEEDEYKGYG
jgi:ATP-dependent Lon protease